MKRMKLLELLLLMFGLKAINKIDDMQDKIERLENEIEEKDTRSLIEKINDEYQDEIAHDYYNEEIKNKNNKKQ